MFKQIIEEKYPGEYEILGTFTNNITKIPVRHIKCGYEWEIIPKTLLKKYTCPKCNSSINEWYIEKYLKENNLKYKKEIWFRECRDILPLPFDFYVIHNGKVHFIEVDGEQHFSQNSFYSKNYYDKIQKHDQIKNEFCKNNNIPLLRLPYTLFEDIPNVYKTLDSFFNI